MKNYVEEIELRLNQFPHRTSSQNPESYIGGGQSRLRFIGLRVPHLNQAMNTGFSFSNKSAKEMSLIWDSIWQNSDCFEVMALALSWFYQPERKKDLVGYWPLLKKWSERIDNWAHSDTLSGIYARILEESPEKVLPTLKKWNRSSNPWLRRLSIVSLIYYRSHRETVLPVKTILEMVESQIEYDHYYVQKGVGWTLREAGHEYPQEIFKFLKKNISRLSPPAFTAATEKLSLKQKEELKKIRKKTRKPKALAKNK